jgi:hypothetical protein
VKKDDAVKCTAILQTSKNMDNPDMKKPHNHQPDENAIIKLHKYTGCHCEVTVHAPNIGICKFLDMVFFGKDHDTFISIWTIVM